MNKLNSEVERVKNKDDFLSFIRLLINDLEDGAWENKSFSEYNKALSTALSKTSLSEKDRYKALSSATRQQKKYGLNDDDLIPRIPGKLVQKKR